MTKNQFLELVEKYKSGLCSESEISLLNEYCELVQEKELMNALNGKDEQAIQYRIYDQINKNISSVNNESANKSHIKWAVAAAVVLFSLSSYMLYTFINRTDERTVAQVEEQTLPLDVISLQLADGTVQVIDENGHVDVLDKQGNVVGTQKGAQIAYSDASPQELLYNTLKIPFGKRFEIRLSDGSIVHLNAGSSLKYPVNFLENQKRDVFLDGEAFFEVAKDPSRPFVVNVGGLDVEVLGTKFNVSSYPEDPTTDVVLVEGSVRMSGDSEQAESKPVILKPGSKGSYREDQQQISTHHVNTLLYTSWISGEMIFRNVPFGNIVRKLERAYDVDIQNYNNPLERVPFNANIDVESESIEDVLHRFSRLYPFRYEKKGNVLLIKP